MATTATGSMPIRMTYTANQGHVDIQAQAAAKNLVWVHDPNIAESYIDVHGLYCHQGPPSQQGSGPLPRAMLVFKGLASAWAT